MVTSLARDPDGLPGLTPGARAGAYARRLSLAARLVAWVFPQVERELGQWRRRLESAGDLELRRQGLASIDKKRFHAQGGSVYALSAAATGGFPPAGAPAGHREHTPPPGGRPALRRNLVSFIVAFQTISDYLDNLCDRAGCLDASAFKQLHFAYTDALDPDRGEHDYYGLYPYRNDGGYLQALVRRCRQTLRLLPSYSMVQDEALGLARLYSELQTYKHAPQELREGMLRNWHAAYAAAYAELDWWEFAAATGSTLGIFALCSAAAAPGLSASAARRLGACYFPWICGLHILLDYFIDQAEDVAAGDLNFVSYYSDSCRRQERLLLFLRRSLDCAAALPDPFFHVTVVQGLPAFYLSDPKVEAQRLQEAATVLLSAGGRETRSMYRACRLLRRFGTI